MDTAERWWVFGGTAALLCVGILTTSLAGVWDKQAVTIAVIVHLAGGLVAAAIMRFTSGPFSVLALSLTVVTVITVTLIVAGSGASTVALLASLPLVPVSIALVLLIGHGLEQLLEPVAHRSPKWGLGREAG